MHTAQWAGPEHHPGESDEFVEVPLLVPNWQLAGLEQVASHWGLTTGQLIRLLLQAYLTGGHHTHLQDQAHQLGSPGK